VEGFQESGESGPKDVVYHWNVTLALELELEDAAAAELEQSAHAPDGLPYLADRATALPKGALGSHL